ncbi:MAG: hypothetical protein M3017_16880 [Actinomycetota bacterium]|nr:hypothetical protein [Actinomycetota bacterium]
MRKITSFGRAMDAASGSSRPRRYLGVLTGLTASVGFMAAFAIHVAGR